MTTDSSPAATATPSVDEHDDEEMPKLRLTRRSMTVLVVFALVAIAFLYFALPRLAGLEDTWRRIEDGDPWWLALAFLFTVLSFAGYVALFQSVYVRGGSRIDFAASYQITMAGLAATRLLAAGGAGGIALTAWALRQSGMERRRVADSTVAFLVLTYAVYMAALLFGGLGLYFGILRGNAPFAMTVVPAIAGAIVISVMLAAALVPTDLERRLQGWACRGGRLARLAARLATAPASVSAGVREALAHIRTGDPAVLGSIAFWAFNIMVLWASFHAFGEPPPFAVLTVAYFVGLLGNLLPLPGGIGGVDGGMIGALAAFSVEVDLAIVAVLTYRGFAFWLPTIPGAIAYFQLRRTVHRWREERALERAATA